MSFFSLLQQKKCLAGTDIQADIELLYKDENTPDLGYDGQLVWEEQGEMKIRNCLSPARGQFLFLCECPLFVASFRFWYEKSFSSSALWWGAYQSKVHSYRPFMVDNKNTWSCAFPSPHRSRRCARLSRTA
jgi:hypothetical protein